MTHFVLTIVVAITLYSAITFVSSCHIKSATDQAALEAEVKKLINPKDLGDIQPTRVDVSPPLENQLKSLIGLETKLVMPFDPKISASNFVKSVIIRCNEQKENGKSSLTLLIPYSNPYSSVTIEISNKTLGTSAQVTKPHVKLAPGILAYTTLEQTSGGSLEVTNVAIDDKFHYEVECAECTDQQVKLLNNVYTIHKNALEQALRYSIIYDLELRLKQHLRGKKIEFESHVSSS